VHGQAEDITSLDWDEVREVLLELELPPRSAAFGKVFSLRKRDEREKSTRSRSYCAITT
jgi:hypothetical protein